MAGILRRLGGIVFDMDGTLLDSADTVPAAYVSCVRELGGREWTPEDVVAIYALGPPAVLLERLLGRPVTEADVDNYHRHVAAGLERLRAYDGIDEVLAMLEASVPIAVYTGASRRAAELLLGHAGLRRRFEVVIGGDEVDHPKPAPDGVLAACAALGVDPAQAAYVGDAPEDLGAGRAAGALAVGAGWGHQFDPEAEADVVLDEPRQLLSLLELP